MIEYETRIHRNRGPVANGAAALIAIYHASKGGITWILGEDEEPVAVIVPAGDPAGKEMAARWDELKMRLDCAETLLVTLVDKIGDLADRVWRLECGLSPEEE